MKEIEEHIILSVKYPNTDSLEKGETVYATCSINGSVDSLSSLLLSAMISNTKLAELVITATDNYNIINTSSTAHLN
jgi:hypothetical protein